MINVEVMASFAKDGGLKPRAFKSGHQVYQLKVVNLAHSIRKGANKVLVFNVSDEANNWTLIYDSENLLWKLDDVIQAV